VNTMDVASQRSQTLAVRDKQKQHDGDTAAAGGILCFLLPKTRERENERTRNEIDDAGFNMHRRPCVHST